MIRTYLLFEWQIQYSNVTRLGYNSVQAHSESHLILIRIVSPYSQASKKYSTIQE